MKLFLALSSILFMAACSPEAAQAFQQAAQNAAAIERANQASMMPPPRQTNCRMIGNSMNCTTW